MNLSGYIKLETVVIPHEWVVHQSINQSMNWNFTSTMVNWNLIFLFIMNDNSHDDHDREQFCFLPLRDDVCFLIRCILSVRIDRSYGKKSLNITGGASTTSSATNVSVERL
ncbi:unnamed protein product [Amoebophrya sp. A25]|nr:unnamed protein product [Amoebophrya sp. A25]|eukprot:GSA25T00020294001.1